MVRIQLPELKRMFDFLSSFIEKARLTQETQEKLKRQQQEQAKLWQQQYQTQLLARPAGPSPLGQVYHTPPPVKTITL
jgi:hypothetical protein